MYLKLNLPKLILIFWLIPGANQIGEEIDLPLTPHEYTHRLILMRESIANFETSCQLVNVMILSIVFYHHKN